MPPRHTPTHLIDCSKKLQARWQKKNMYNGHCFPCSAYLALVVWQQWTHCCASQLKHKFTVNALLSNMSFFLFVCLSVCIPLFLRMCWCWVCVFAVMCNKAFIVTRQLAINKWNKGNKKRCRAYVSFFCLISSLTSSVNEVYRSKVDERVEREEQQRRESPIGISLLNNLRYPSQWSTFEWKSTVSTRDGDGYGKKD